MDVSDSTDEGSVQKPAENENGESLNLNLKSQLISWLQSQYVQTSHGEITHTDLYKSYKDYIFQRDQVMLLAKKGFVQVLLNCFPSVSKITRYIRKEKRRVRLNIYVGLGKVEERDRRAVELDSKMDSEDGGVDFEMDQSVLNQNDSMGAQPQTDNVEPEKDRSTSLTRQQNEETESQGAKRDVEVVKQFEDKQTQTSLTGEVVERSQAERESKRAVEASIALQKMARTEAFKSTLGLRMGSYLESAEEFWKQLSLVLAKRQKSSPFLVLCYDPSKPYYKHTLYTVYNEQF
eukprot:m.143324 g.143324  ORF g.143324 m.143324 type:complete len:291 (+) comp38384_c0_seq2:98-970(+)